MRFSFLIGFCLFLTMPVGKLWAQTSNTTSSIQPFIDGLQFTAVSIDDETPKWAWLLYQPNANIFEVESAFKKWRKKNPTIKNGHTRNLKHYLNYLYRIDGISNEGLIKPGNEERVYREKKNWEKSRAQIIEATLNKSRTSGNTDWESMGPFMMYRDGQPSNIQANIYAIDQSISNPNIVYASSEAGATVFKSIDKGDTWISVNDDMSFSGPRELEIHPTDPETVYLGSQHDIYKTTNGGASWNSIYYNWNNAASSIIINPNDANQILAAGSERILRSTDGGTNWSEVWTGRCYDLKFKPGEPNIVYALINNSSSLQNDFYKSTDGGLTWSKITNGWPNETSIRNYGGRMTVSTGTPGLIYAFIGSEWTASPTPKDGVKVMKSLDSGESWTTVLNYDNNHGLDSGQGYYDWDIEVSDNDPDIVYVGTQGRYLTTDGFTSGNWAYSGGSLGHADVQEVLFNGSDLWVANDGGIIKFDNETFSSYQVKQQGINAVSYWSFDQGWNRDAQVGSHYHNGTSARQETYVLGEYLSYGGAEPQFSAIKHPTPDKAWSKGYGSINGKTLPDNISDPILSFNYNITPNAEYGSSTWRESEIEVLPYAYNTHFTGADNNLYRSDDFGLSWAIIASFGTTDSKVTKIEIPRSNPDVMYVAVYNSAGYSIFRSNDLGLTFTQLNGPGGLSDDGVYISVDQNNEDIIYLASSNGGTSNEKVYKSIDGGNSWVNLTTDVLDNHSLRAMLSIAGTDGGVYVLSSNAVFYINNTLSDWQPLLINLPSQPALRDIKPFYKEGKIRVAGDGRGVWGAELYDTPTLVTPQPTVNLVEANCNRDTLYFDDFSIVNHTNTNWSWTITPAPAYVDNLNIRNPKVVFGAPGIYSATMQMIVDGVVYTKALNKDIVVTTGCDPVGLSGNAYDVTSYGEHATIKEINRTLDSFTMSMWIRPRASQVATAFMVSKDIQNVGINYYGSTKQLTIHYPTGSTWAVQTGLYAPEDRWTHVAVSSDHSTGEIKLFVNGECHTYSGYNTQPIEFNTIQLGWQHNWWGSRWFNGEIDEFCLYDRALTQDEIRLQMHLTKSPMDDPGLLHYYQFNESGGGLSYDKVGILHCETRGSRVSSRGPIGAGSSSKVTIDNTGTFEFPSEGLKMTFGSGTLPEGEVTITRITNSPDTGAGIGQLADSYWVLHNYGSNTTFTGLNSMEFYDLGNSASNYNANDFLLQKRATDQDGPVWIEDASGEYFDANLGQVNFGSALQVSEFGQFAVNNNRAFAWKGIVSEAWDNPLNWQDEILPDSGSDVIIPANTPFQPVVSSNVSIQSLTLMNEATIRVETGVSFIIYQE